MSNTYSTIMILNFRRIHIALILMWGLNLSASDTLSDSTHSSVNEETHEESKFNVGEFVFDHILDSYNWHITGDIAVPLPVIILTTDNQWHIFLSYKFHHGHSDYKGLRWVLKGTNKGKIVQINQDGSETLPKLDISITKNAASLIFGSALMLFIFLSVASAYKRRPNKAPHGLQNVVEPFIIFVRDDIAKSNIGPKYEKYVPFLLTVFFFIWINNILGLIPIFPGGANLTGNIAITGTLALFTLIMVVVNSNKHYWLEIIDPPGVPNWLKYYFPLLPILEIVGFFNRPLVLMIRLFANITAGHVIILGFVSLIFIFGKEGTSIVGALSVAPLAVAFDIFMSFLELLVALIQAYVFALLSAIYIGMAVAEPHHNNH